MKDVFESLVAARNATQVLDDLKGRILSIKYAVVYSVDDPMKLHRIQVLEPEKGGKTPSNWLMRLTLYSGLSLPIPKPGDTALIGYINGDSHQGVYFGIVSNQVNPPVGDGSNIVLTCGNINITVSPNGNIVINGFSQLQLQGDTIALQASQVTINGNDVTTVGAKDNRNDVLVTKGY